MAIAFVSSALVAAQSGLAPPQIGFVRDQAHRVRPLLGISGNFWMGEEIARSAESAASSGVASMVKTWRDVRVLDALGRPVGRPFVTSPGSAMFAFTPTGAPGLAWLRAPNRLLRWNGQLFIPLPAVDPDANVISIAAPDSSTAAFLVEREGVLWRAEISLFDGSIAFATRVPGITAPALLFNDGAILYARGSTLVFRSVNGVERTTELATPPVEFAIAGRDWVLIDTTQSTQLAFRISTGAVFELPDIEEKRR